MQYKINNGTNNNRKTAVFSCRIGVVVWLWDGLTLWRFKEMTDSNRNGLLIKLPEYQCLKGRSTLEDHKYIKGKDTGKGNTNIFKE